MEAEHPVVHMHTALCSSTRQALPFGQSEEWQGFWQNALTHACVTGHSESEEQATVCVTGQLSSPATLMASLFLHVQTALWDETTHFSWSAQVYPAQGLLQIPALQY
jgi:hypothetical protein